MTTYENSDGLPTFPQFNYLTDDRLDSVKADESDILKYFRRSKQI